MQKVKTPLENIHYWTAGNPENPPIVLVHGFTGTHEGFQYIWPLLENDFFVIIPDLPGFGESPLPEKPWTLAHLAKHVNHFVEALKLAQKPVLVSHSMGGLVAAHMLIQHPKLFSEKRIFISPVATKVKLADSRKAGEIGGILQYGAARKVHKFASSKTISRVATRAIITTKEKALCKKIYEHHFKNLEFISSPSFYYQLHRNINRQGVVDMSDSLREFGTLIISGNQDNVTPLAGQKTLAQKLSATLEIIPGVGHLAHYERPDAIAAAVVSFLE